MKVLYLSLIVLTTNVLMAGCGGCQVKNPVDPQTKSSSFLSDIPFNGKVEGFVIASCNKCNLGKKDDKKCSMGVQVGKKVYRLKNDNHDHNAAHKTDGICNSLRVAYVDGQIMMNYLDANYFELLDAPLNN